MTRLFNEPSRFADQLAEGFAVASSRWVRAVPGGVVRSTEIAPGTVVVVIGGGSGHYPAFGGLVGQGLAHGAAMGNVFASPSAQQVYSVAKAADVGGGILLAYCNYAGDVLNFDQAQERLRAEGIDCRTVVVTDDIYSAPADEIHRRRGIAGNLAVFKTAGAAAEAGYSLDEVVRVAASANARTRSFGVAFNGCTLPGASAPLFTVPKGRMAIGLGIHGEPGVGEQGIPTADGLAELLVSTLLAETPPKVDSASGSRAVVLLNSLGSVTFEELFVVYRRLGQLLESAGITVVEPEVGHLCTSFDMAGVSLTLFWVDDELERLWRAPADTPAFRKGSVVPAGRADASTAGVFASNNIALASPESRASVVVVVSALQSVVSAIDEQVEELGRIDAVAGDGDHGIGMQRGARAAFEAAHKAHELGAGVGTVLSCAADAWADRAGGASGALWGVALNALAKRLGDSAAPDSRSVSEGVANALAAVLRFGKASIGDKTMVDALAPFSEVLSRAAADGVPLADAWGAAAEEARGAAAKTAALVPRIGRARLHPTKSLGTPDAGAASFAVVVSAVHRVLVAEGQRVSPPGESK